MIHIQGQSFDETIDPKIILKPFYQNLIGLSNQRNQQHQTKLGVSKC